jgi:predicted RNase H-like HicB family nuclease
MTEPLDPMELYLSRPYEWRMQWDKSDCCWVVTIDEIPDFFAAGAKPAEAAANARDAFISHIRGYIAAGIAVPMPNVAEARGETAVSPAPDLVAA